MSKWWEETSLPVILVGSRLVAGTKAVSIRHRGQNWKASLSQNYLGSSNSFSAWGPLFYGNCACWSPFSSKAWVVGLCFLTIFSPLERLCVLVAMRPVALGLQSHHSSQCSVSGPFNQGLYPALLCLDVVQGPRSPGVSRTLRPYCPAPILKHSCNCD